MVKKWWHDAVVYEIYCKTNREETEPSLRGRKVWLPWEAEVYVRNKETA